MHEEGQHNVQPHSGPAAVAAPLETLIQQISSIPAPEEKEQQMADGKFDADIVVIGSGPGGYVAAIRAAQLGAKVIVVEKAFLGGTCLNVGCIPSKALIGTAERLNHAKHAAALGVKVGEVSLDFEATMKRKEKIVQTQRGGIGMLFKKNGIKHIDGFGSFVDAHTIEVEKDGKKERVTAKNFILAMGSKVIHLPIPGLEGGAENNVWTSDDAVAMSFVPKKVAVLGGGAVGCEFSYILNSFGSEVHLVEMMPNLIPFADPELGVELGKLLGRQGIKVRTGATIEKCEKSGEGWKVHIKKGADIEVIEVDVVLLGVGRKAATDGMNLEKVGIQLHRGSVQVVDATLQTHVPNIYGIGDVITGVPGHVALAHVASHEGIAVVTNIINGTKKPVDYKVVPNAVYTVPEVASVGLTEGQAKEAGYDVVVGKANFRIFGKAMAIGEQDGFVKVVGEKKYGEVLGIHMIGPHVTDMIHEGVAALKLEATIDSIAETIHAHPTLAEAILEAFEDAQGHAIHK